MPEIKGLDMVQIVGKSLEKLAFIDCRIWAFRRWGVGKVLGICTRAYALNENLLWGVGNWLVYKALTLL